MDAPALSALVLLAALCAALALVCVLCHRAATGQARAATAERRLHAAIEALPGGFVLFDADGRLAMCNGAYREMALLHEPLKTPRGLEGCDLVQQLADGRWLHIVGRPCGEGRFVGFCTDISRLAREREEEARAKRLLLDAVEVMPAGFELYDTEERLILCNGALRAMFPKIAHLMHAGVHFEDLVRANVAAGDVPGVDGTNIEPWLRQRVAARGAQREPRLTGLADGRWVRLTEKRLSDGEIVAVRIDVTELVLREREIAEANRKLEELAQTDALTGIANRRHFDRRLREEWARAARHMQPLALVMIDVDHFKRFNDRHGHVKGDACLRAVAQALAGCAKRAGELVARFGGEEFVVLLPDATPSAAQALAARCVQAIDALALPHGDSPVGPYLTISAGVAAAVAHCGGDGAELVDAADGALYEAKRQGRHGVAMAPNRPQGTLAAEMQGH